MTSPISDTQNRRRIKLALSAVISVLFLAATDSTVVGTLLPVIRNSLGDPALYPWIMSGFLMPLALIAPVSGALGDRFGARRVLTAGVLIFIFGSIGAALSQSMPWFVTARVVQGIGAGMIIVLSYAMLAILYGPEQRGRMQGILSGVWGLAAILGPLIGAGINAAIGWHWVFWLNIPIGTFGIVLLLLSSATGRQIALGTKIDGPSQLLFALSALAVLLLLSNDAEKLRFGLNNSFYAITLLSIIILIWRVRQDRARSPVPTAFLANRRLLSAAVLTLLSSAGLYASVTLLPIALNQARGDTPATVSIFITAAALGWVLGSAFCGNLLRRLGYRVSALLGAIMLTLGAFGLAETINASYPVLAGAEFLIGAGMGFIATTTLVLSQNLAPKTHIGAYTSTIQLLRNIGAALGINALAEIQLQGANSPGSFQYSFTILALLMSVGIFFSLFLPCQYDSYRETSSPDDSCRR